MGFLEWLIERKGKQREKKEIYQRNSKSYEPSQSALSLYAPKGSCWRGVGIIVLSE